MKYEAVWKKTLNEDEKIIREFSIGNRYLRWRFWLSGILFTLLMIWLLFFPFVGIPIILLVWAWCWFFYRFYLPPARAYALTDKRILIHRGWLSTNATSIRYGSVVEISVREPFLARKFTGTGDISIKTSGRGHIGPLGKHDIYLTHVDTPYEIKKAIEKRRGQREDQSSLVDA
jgi:hypothetical protein